MSLVSGLFLTTCDVNLECLYNNNSLLQFQDLLEVLYMGNLRLQIRKNALLWYPHASFFSKLHEILRFLLHIQEVKIFAIHDRLDSHKGRECIMINSYLYQD